MNTIKIRMKQILCLLTTLTAGMILFAGCARPSNHLLSWQMILGTIATTFAVFFLFHVYRFILSKHGDSRYNDLIFYLLFAIWGGMLLMSGVFCRNRPDSMIDYRILYQFASETNIGHQFDYYFEKYNNNFKPALYLRLIYQTGKKLGMNDPYYLVMSAGVLIVLLAALSVRYMLGCCSRQKQLSLQIPMIMTFMVFLPIYAYSQVMYTDSMSFCIAISGLALMEKADSSEGKKKYLFFFLAGILFALGYTIKATVLIPLIAYCISKNLKSKESFINSLPFKKICIGLLGAFLGLLLTETAAMQYEIYRTSRDTSDPALSWVALGLKNDGSYYMNSDFADKLHTFSTKEEKKQFTYNYIRTNRSEFFNKDHIIAKFVYQFSDANFKLRDFSYAYYGDENLIYHMFCPIGNYYWRTSQICFCVLFSIYAIYFLDGAKNLILGRKQEISEYTMTADLSLIGYAIFFMIWETSPRQLYNLVPILIWGFLLHLDQSVRISGHVTAD